MNDAREKQKKGEAAVLLAAVCMLTVFICLVLYQYDNKYTADGPKGEQGVLQLEEQSLEDNPVIFLVDGWEYYGGRLLTPADFAGDPPMPDAYIFVGQYGGFEAGDLSASPHGSASYRITIRLPEEERSYLLELPEIFSAYRAYANGKLIETMGEPDPAGYRPETGNRTAKIEAAGQIELLIAVSDFSHFYSGMVYPPSFGIPSAVEGLLSARLIFRSLLLSFALAVGMIALLVGIAGGRKPYPVLFGLLCVFLIGYTGYPVFKTVASGFYPYYIIETVSFCAMLATVSYLQKSISGQKGKTSWILIGLGLLLCLLSAALPAALRSGWLWVMGGYSYLVMAYEWITAAYLTAAVAKAAKREGSKTLLAGILVFDTALIMDRLLPFHEPIITGWFPELASFVLVLCTGLVVAREIAVKYKDSAVMEERARSMERLSEMQKTNYDLLRERIEETRTIQHDLRHHFVMIEGFVQDRNDKGLESYLQTFQESITRVRPVGYSQNPVVNVLVRHYAELAEQEGVQLRLKLEVMREIPMSEADLCAILSNLLENSLEACRRGTDKECFISLSIGQKPSMLSVHIENSAEEGMRRQRGKILSSKGKNRIGYGLASVCAIAERYGGGADFRFDGERKVFISTVLLLF